MRDWISDLLIFSAGITGGILRPLNLSPEHRDPAHRDARRIWPTSKSDAMKKFYGSLPHHRSDRGELAKSLQTLRNTVTTALDPLTEPHDDESGPTIQPSDSIESHRSTL